MKFGDTEAMEINDGKALIMSVALLHSQWILSLSESF